MTKSKLGRKGFIWLMFPSLKEVRARTQVGPKHRGRSWYRGHGGVLLIGLLIMACSACFLTEPRTTAQGWHHTQWAGLFHMNHQLRKCPTGLPIALSYFLNWGSPLSDDFSLCQVNIKLGSMLSKPLTNWAKSPARIYFLMKKKMYQAMGFILTPINILCPYLSSSPRFLFPPSAFISHML